MQPLLPHFVDGDNVGMLEIRGGLGFGVGTAIGLGILAGAAYDSNCMAQRVFNTPTGPVVRWVNVCY